MKLLTAGWQRGDGRSIFCVGDPMQSIYGFRQAEVRCLPGLAEEGVGDVRFDVEASAQQFPLRRAAGRMDQHDVRASAAAGRRSGAGRHRLSPAASRRCGRLEWTMPCRAGPRRATLRRAVLPSRESRHSAPPRRAAASRTAQRSA